MRLLILTLALLFAPQTGPQTTAIPLVNPSFSQGEEGWQFSAGSSVVHITLPCEDVVPCIVNSGGLPVAVAGYGSYFQQTIHVPAMPVGIYTLKFSVANWFYWYPGEATAAINLSKFYENPACHLSVHPLGDFTQYTLLCTVRDMVAQDLTISVHDKGWQSLFKDFTLTFTPED